MSGAVRSPTSATDEGEMLEAVLVKRIIADTEPSPVVFQISKEIPLSAIFEGFGRY